MLDQTAKTTLIYIRGVCRSFPKGSGEALQVLDKVDLTIHAGEIVGLLGRSGSGKSTLLRIIAGLIAPSSGDARCRGETIQGPPNGVAMVFQSFALFPWLTVLQNVCFGLREKGLPLQQQLAIARPFIEKVGLRAFESHYPRQLSGGMQQRTALARALANDPRLILADEPTGNLDIHSSQNVMRIVRDLAHSGERAVVVVTHEQAFARSADRTITVVDGRIASPASAESLIAGRLEDASAAAERKGVTRIERSDNRGG